MTAASERKAHLQESASSKAASSLQVDSPLTLPDDNKPPSPCHVLENAAVGPVLTIQLHSSRAQKGFHFPFVLCIRAHSRLLV